ncbi:MAG TPA: hypothetical protein VGN18_00600 [Jatrophihabitans sp.]|jgi:hypothetical protein|uniref:hypothetical protein n=1 Tax=Jatrophihabitans sp. TaxID=1932789 RepID=UPI002E0BF0C7|nr:hypothetical protein [Jatrophihabitans sp.]
MVGPALATARLDAAGRYIHWGVIQISLTNLLVIIAMIVLFGAAVVLRMPHSDSRPVESERSDDPR